MGGGRRVQNGRLGGMLAVSNSAMFLNDFSLPKTISYVYNCRPFECCPQKVLYNGIFQNGFHISLYLLLSLLHGERNMTRDVTLQS